MDNRAPHYKPRESNCAPVIHLDDHLRKREQAAKDLDIKGQVIAAPSFMLEKLRGQDEATRARILTTLKAGNQEELRARLIEIVEDENANLQWRCDAVHLLSRLPGSDVELAMLRLLINKEDEKILRYYALYNMQSSTSRKALDVFWFLAGDMTENPDIRELARKTVLAQTTGNLAEEKLEG